MGAGVVRVYCDRDASAYRKGARRPEFVEMLDAVRRREVDVVIAYRVDRLARAARDWGVLLELVDDYKLRIVGAADGVDTSTQGGRLILGILAEVARQESSTIGMRVSSAQRAKALRGEPHPARDRGFGHTADFSAVVPHEAREVRKAVARIIAGDSLAAILRDWRLRGVQTTRGQGWHRTTMRRMLVSARIAGCREVDGKLIPGLPRIVSVDDLVRVRAVLLNPDRGGRRLTRGASLLSGLIVCSRCGASMYPATMNGRRVYRCVRGTNMVGCSKTNIGLAVVDEEVSVRVSAVIPNVKLPEADDEAVVALRNLDARRAELAADYAAGRISRGEWTAARAAIGSEAEHLSGRLRRAPAPADLEAAWSRGDEATRRVLLGRLISRIVILPHPGGRPDPVARIRIEWSEEAT